MEMFPCFGETVSLFRCDAAQIEAPLRLINSRNLLFHPEHSFYGVLSPSVMPRKTLYGKQLDCTPPTSHQRGDTEATTGRVRRAAIRILRSFLAFFPFATNHLRRRFAVGVGADPSLARGLLFRGRRTL